MTSHSRSYGPNSDWDNKNDYNSPTYDSYQDDDSSNGGLDHCRLYITNIPRGLNEEGLRSAFAKFGTLVEAHMSKDPTKRYGLIKYETSGEAKLAMMKMNQTEPLCLSINVAKASGTQRSGRKQNDWQDRSSSIREKRHSTGHSRRDRVESADSSRGRQSGTPDEMPNENMEEIMIEDDYGFSDMLDPNLHLELENIKLEQLKVREEQLQCKKRVILLKQAERRPMGSQGTLSNRCILPDGKIVVRNSERTDSRDNDVPFSAGAGDSKETSCSCKSKSKAWEHRRNDDGTSTPSTCVLCSDDRSHNKSYRDKSITSKLTDKKSDYSSKIIGSKTTGVTSTSKTKKSDCSKATDTYSKRSDATSKKDMKKSIKCRSEVTCDLKYSNFYSDSDDEDETNRLIQLRNADYMDIVDEDLKLVIALAGYPKSKMRLRQMELFQRSLTDVIDMQLKSGLLKRVPAFLDYYLNRGALVCICKDAVTRDWMVQISPGLQERMCNNLVLLKSKVKRLCLAMLKIPKSCWPATAQDAFKLLQYFNPMLKTAMWKIYAQKIVDDVECTSFLIDRVSGEIIRGPSFKNVIDYSQMEFELSAYTEIYYECLLSDMEEDLSSMASRVKFLGELRSGDATPRNTDSNFKAVAEETFAKDEETQEDEQKEYKSDAIQDAAVKRELDTNLQMDILKKLKDVKYIGEGGEVLVWSEDTNNFGEVENEKDDNVKQKEEHQYINNNIASTSAVAVSDKTESIIESNENLISRSSNLNIDSNRGIAYHRRTNYLHVENELKVAITLEGYPQNKLEGTHIRRLKHLFKEYLHKDMKMQRFTNLIIPKFQDIYLSNGAVIYICDSLETKDYLTEVLPKFINSTGLKLTFRDIKCLVRYTRIVMRLPKEHAHVESVEILLKLMGRYPGLKPDCWKYYSDVAGKQKRQFGVDPESLEVIKSPDFDPTYDGDKITFRIIDRQKRDVSFEESNKETDDGDTKKQRDVVTKSMYVPIEPEIMAAPLKRIRTNHYSDLIADDLKLYVGPSNYPESRVDEALFHSIKRTLENTVLEIIEKDESNDENIPKIHDIYLFDGVIFIICVNMASRNWIGNVLPSINEKLHIHLKSTEFRGAVGIISMFVKTDKDTDEVIAILQQQNPRLRTKYWRKISTVRTKTNLDVVLQIDKLSAQVITSHNFNRYVGPNAVKFKLGHLQSLLKPKASLEKLNEVHTNKQDTNNDLEINDNVKSRISMQELKDKSFEEFKSELKKEFSGFNSEQWSVLAEEDNVKPYSYDSIDDEIAKSKKDEFSISPQQYFYQNKTDDRDPVIIEPESPKSVNNDIVLAEQQGYHKMIMKIPLPVLPDNKDDLNIIFDLLEDKNPGLNTELWQVFTESEYPSNGKFTVYVDKQSVSVLQGKNFDPSVGGEKIKFYF